MVYEYKRVSYRIKTRKLTVMEDQNTEFDICDTTTCAEVCTVNEFESFGQACSKVISVLVIVLI